MCKMLSLCWPIRISLFSALLFFCQCQRHSATSSPSGEGMADFSSTDQVGIVSDSQPSKTLILEQGVEQLLKLSDQLVLLDQEQINRVRLEGCIESEIQEKEWTIQSAEWSVWETQLGEWLDWVGQLRKWLPSLVGLTLQSVNTKAEELEKLLKRLEVSKILARSLAKSIYDGEMHRSGKLIWKMDACSLQERQDPTNSNTNISSAAAKLKSELAKLKLEADKLKLEAAKLKSAAAKLLNSRAQILLLKFRRLESEDELKKFVRELEASANQLLILMKELKKVLGRAVEQEYLAPCRAK